MSKQYNAGAIMTLFMLCGSQAGRSAIEATSDTIACSKTTEDTAPLRHAGSNELGTQVIRNTFEEDVADLDEPDALENDQQGAPQREDHAAFAADLCKHDRGRAGDGDHQDLVDQNLDGCPFQVEPEQEALSDKGNAQRCLQSVQNPIY